MRSARNWFQKKIRSSQCVPPPRAELLSSEQLNLLAIQLAQDHQIDPRRGRNCLLRRLDENEKVLVEAYDLVTKMEGGDVESSAACEWLLDNFYLVEQQIRATKLHLPGTYSKELPRLRNGISSGFPRVYDIVLQLISHTDGRVDTDNLTQFIASYQTVTPLTLGELWAIPIMLRLGLIENLRQVSEHISHRRRDRNLATYWTSRLLGNGDNPSSVLRVLAELAESDPPLRYEFIQEFLTGLQGKGNGQAIATVQSWVEHRLAEADLTREALQRAANHQRAADQIAIGHSIGSLRQVDVVDWRHFVETMSVVEEALSSDPAGIYPKMDFATRDRYRHRVERLSRRSRLSEAEVAQAAVALARTASVDQGRPEHVGVFLIGKNRRDLDRSLGIRASPFHAARSLVSRAALPLYVLAILTLTAQATWCVVRASGPMDGHTGWIWLLVAAVAVSASQLAVSVVNLLFNFFARPRPVPKLDYTQGIPAADSTMVVVPTLLTSPAAVASLIEDLELRYLGNRDPHLYFALLTDYRDAPEARQDDDETLLELAREGIHQLNARYPREGTITFHLFHRPRVWNPHEELWMGYERKRGKLKQFNTLLRGDGRDRFSEVITDASIFPSIRYVITLDTDTTLPRDAARKLVGAMAHPLNRPLLDPHTGKVEEGYAILQPRTPISLHAANRSRFSQLSCHDAGLDPYTNEVSDLYQDLFAEGSYVGKGIYDVDAFQSATNGRFPENLILSHDLVESCFARSALITEVLLFEDHPASFTAEMARRHRWIRGDWQIAGWLLPRVPVPGKSRVRNTISALGRWKIFDNLRRSLVPPAMLATLILGWLLAPSPPGLWALTIVTFFLIPAMISGGLHLLRKPREQSIRGHLQTIGRDVARQVAEAGISIASFPYRAAIHLDAIAASAFRMPFTRRGLLIWHTRRYALMNRVTTLPDGLKEMWVQPLAAILGVILLSLVAPGELWLSGLILMLWLLFPVVSWSISRPLPRGQTPLTEPQKAYLRRLSRLTWRYYEVFATEAENWLAPDNFQEVPEPVIASRTSPTNMGMGLLANLAAMDFGYLSPGEMLDRTEKGLSSMERLERYRGHFYNWYDTRTLQTLMPPYVSSVDSGNLAGALATLRSGLAEMPDLPILPPAVFAGLRDTLTMVSAPEAELLSRMLHEESPIGAGRAKEWLGEVCRLAEMLPKDGDDEERRWWSRAFARQAEAALADLTLLMPQEVDAGAPIPTLRELAEAGQSTARDRIDRIGWLMERCDHLGEMDFSFLYDPERDLLSIGYNVNDRRLDPSFYDLLASEARLASFLLVAKGHLRQEHWFSLGRQLTTQGGSMALLSWSGSMFEYLMPLVLMPTYEHTLLDETYRAVIARQIEYGRHRGVPWGISESCYHLTDTKGTYQYTAFGVPGLGYKRGLADDLVIAPYATALALLVKPREACQNLERLAAEGFLGAYGLYEAIDYTPSRVPRGKTSVTLRCYMAHHHGMSLLSFASVLLQQPMQRRFLADPRHRAADLLLCERIPTAPSSLQPHAAEVNASRRPPEKAAAMMRVFDNPDTPIPEVHLLSNGRFHVMATNAGGGYCRWNNLAVTRWREDATSDDWGVFCYMRDLESGRFWSATHHPTRRQADHYEAIFVEGRAEYRRRDHEIETYLEIAVSPEHDVEVRRITLTNFSAHDRRVELTSYAEVVLAPQNADLAHPAFSNLFVQTEILPGAQAILATRRARAAGENPPWMFHLMTTQGSPAIDPSYETSRSHFLGRTRHRENPAAFDRFGSLTNSEGSVLDPIVSIRGGVVIAPDTSANLHFITGVASTREAALALVEQYRDPSFAARAFEMAWSHSQLELHQMQTSEADAQAYGKLAGSIVYANQRTRAPSGILARNTTGQSGLWAFGISGDLPILLLRIADVHRIHLVKHLLKAHAYWHGKGLEVDLVILNEDHSGYRQELQDRINGLIAAGTESHRVDKPGGIFVRRSEDLTEQERILLQAVARVVISDNTVSLSQENAREFHPGRRVKPFIPTRKASKSGPSHPAPDHDLIFFNGLGGFTKDGREYVIRLDPGQATPAPWSNLLANPRLGSIVSECGQAYTWFENANEFRLTPWANDPISDAAGEAFYLRDEETGQYWSPTPLPARGTGTYKTRHGFGYSVFESRESGIHTEMWTYVATDAPVKVIFFKLRNETETHRRLSVTGYWEWVLGRWRHQNGLHVITEFHPAVGTVFARNEYNREFAGRVAFAGTSAPNRSVTCSRAEFLGRNGTLSRPAAMSRQSLSGFTGVSSDPCAAIQAPFDLPAGRSHEVVFILGAGSDANEAQQLARRFASTTGARFALEGVWEFWKRTLGTVHAETPDPALNLLVNGWLEYQTLACRYWGRSGYYQSGGAYGFRDQLQDTTALIHAAPWTTREHLLRAASRQFLEGDVQHWWHPPVGRGVRTHFSDDYLWLPYCVSRYVQATGDTGVLDERIAYLQGRPVNEDEESYYDLPHPSGKEETLYEHCLRAIQNGLRFGEHGLPLIGCGDWNDGMNLIGEKGKGESVWLAFFLYDVLMRFAGIARRREDLSIADFCEGEAARLQSNIEAKAWDGEWYRRAYFDDGTPLGSSTNDECRIDSIAQSWAVLSGAADPDRCRQAMESVDRHLVRREARLIQLFDPPFDRSELEPGYIKGYIPGVRENGGQYTHAAIWTVMAFARLGEISKAWELFSLLNPVRHAADPEGMARYKVEPYVVAADIYSVAPHTGRGGWTWYTGSAGWMYRLIVETLLGLEVEADRLRLDPLLPDEWDGFRLHYRYRDTLYHLHISRGGDRRLVTVDGVECPDGTVSLVNDHRDHAVELKLP